MKALRSATRALTIAMALLCAVAMGGVAYASRQVPDRMDRAVAASLSGGLSLRPSGEAVSVAASDAVERTLTLWGVIPVKTVRLTSAAERSVILGGTPFGCVLDVQNVLVVGFSDVRTKDGVRNPAREAGLKAGDVLLTVNGVALQETVDLSMPVAKSEGKSLNLTYMREGETRTATVRPAYSVDEGCYKLGLWVRDSEAGVGMLSFGDPENGLCVGLGHALRDADTGADFAIVGGDVYRAKVLSVEKGAAGSPGQISGCIQAGQPIGRVLYNGNNGVYFAANSTLEGREVPLASPEEATRGDATLVVAIAGEEAKDYSITIERVRTSDDEGKNLVVRVVDEELLALTGGIVQGMSGSPILQNGKLIGILTHVLVDDPARGYAIFSDTMYETMRALSDKKAAVDDSRFTCYISYFLYISRTYSRGVMFIFRLKT